jgi:FtsX-like permease family protein
MSLVLLVGAGLFVRSMRAGLSTDIGFDPRPLAAVTVDARLMGYTPAAAQSYYAEALRRAADLPGVTGAALATHVPLAPVGGALPFVASSLVALAISAVGIYGVVAHSVNRQRPEIGIGLALGAPGLDVLQLVIERNAVVVMMGIVAGLAGAALTSRTLAGFLYGITRLDGAAFATATAVMLAAAVLACVVPARRALHVDPLTVLREA